MDRVSLRNYFVHPSWVGLEGDPPRTNRKQGHRRNNRPQEYPLQKWTSADATDCVFRQPCPDQEQYDRKTNFAEMTQHGVYLRSDREVCLRHCCQAEQKNEPRP